MMSSKISRIIEDNRNLLKGRLVSFFEGTAEPEEIQKGSSESNEISIVGHVNRPLSPVVGIPSELMNAKTSVLLSKIEKGNDLQEMKMAVAILEIRRSGSGAAILEIISKGKDYSHLIKKTITNKKGKSQTVYTKPKEAKKTTPVMDLSSEYTDLLHGEYKDDKSVDRIMSRTQKFFGGYRDRAVSAVDIDPIKPDVVYELMKQYQDRHYQNVNAVLRGVETDENKVAEASKFFDALDHITTSIKADSDFVSYRGIKWKPGVLNISKLEDLDRMEEINDPAYLSTSVIPDVGSNFASSDLPDGDDEFEATHPVVMRITVKKGHPMFPIESYHDYKGESEVLLPRGTTLSIKGVRKEKTKDNISYTVLEVETSEYRGLPDLFPEE